MLRASILSALIGAGFMAGAGGIEAAPIFRGGYYEENVNITCATGASCTATFAAVPEEVFLRRASCSVLTSAPQVRRAVLGQLAGGTVRRSQFLVPRFVLTAAGKSQYIVSTDVTLQMDAGEIPAIRVFANPSVSQSLACQIIGETGPT